MFVATFTVSSFSLKSVTNRKSQNSIGLWSAWGLGCANTGLWTREGGLT